MKTMVYQSPASQPIFTKVGHFCYLHPGSWITICLSIFHRFSIVFSHIYRIIQRSWAVKQATCWVICADCDPFAEVGTGQWRLRLPVPVTPFRRAWPDASFVVCSAVAWPGWCVCFVVIFSGSMVRKIWKSHISSQRQNHVAILLIRTL